MTCFSWLY